MNVLYEGLLYVVVEKNNKELTIKDKNGNVKRVDESEVVVLNNLNEDI